MTNRQERLLIQRLQRHWDKRAANRLIQEYYREIYTYVFRQLGEKEQAMDLTQEIFLGMLQSIWNYNPGKAGFRTWLYQIATYKIVDYYRSSACKREQKQIPWDEVSLEGDWDVERFAANREMVGEIFRWLRNRDRTLEEIFRLKFYGEYTFEEIGNILALSVSTVKTKYYAALKTLRKEFLE